MTTITDAVKSLIRSRVQKGIQRLTEENPHWKEQVNLETLDMDSGEECVLGQLYGHLGTAQTQLKLGWSDLITLGFMENTSDPFGPCELTAVWKEELTKS